VFAVFKQFSRLREEQFGAFEQFFSFKVFVTALIICPTFERSADSNALASCCVANEFRTSLSSRGFTTMFTLAVAIAPYLSEACVMPLTIYEDICIPALNKALV
jgi:hypothetical protein